MNYKENSLNFKYASQTLEVNFLLEDIFKESSQILQAIRFFVKNDFFKEWDEIIVKLFYNYHTLLLLLKYKDKVIDYLNQLIPEME